ncbi:amidohydrolase [Tumebacillus flagellatus]|uniref:5-methylthioadenosine/S-adenosylhomocysteine deaminase n=1 Tax=Tumebacillus flagellatus TaxID=1157490 RepID=A0A074MEU9_9BACL|nr:amidohydrolase [Tumebacillus flagellatus]KEO84317.1 N-ethylammeline chlorohydrolase [Tumebacillus flagellatus]
MARTLIHGGVVIPVVDDSYHKEGYIIIEDQRIAEVGAGAYTGSLDGFDTVIDAKGKLAMPGLINTHGHASMTLLRGYADDLPLQQWLEERCWPIEAKMTDEDIYWGAQLAILEMLKGGTTTFTDMFYFMDRVAQATEESGIRAVLSRGMVGFDPENGVKLKDQAVQFVKDWHGKADGRVNVMFGPHAEYTCPKDYLAEAANVAAENKRPVQIHLCETVKEVQDCIERYGKSPVALLEEVGMFNNPTLVAHAVHVTDEDIAILKKHNVTIAHNPDSNLKLGSGVAPVLKFLEAGLTVGLGTDGAASNNNLDMFEEMRMAAMLHKGVNLDPVAVNAFQAVQMATNGGAKALFLEDTLGTLQAGALADIILLDIEQPQYYPHRHNMIAHLAYASNSRDVTDVFVNGKQLVKDRRVLTLDEKKIYAEIERICERLYAE